MGCSYLIRRQSATSSTLKINWLKSQGVMSNDIYRVVRRSVFCIVFLDFSVVFSFVVFVDNGEGVFVCRFVKKVMKKVAFKITEDDIIYSINITYSIKVIVLTFIFLITFLTLIFSGSIGLLLVIIALISTCGPNFIISVFVFIWLAFAIYGMFQLIFWMCKKSDALEKRKGEQHIKKRDI